MIFSPASLSVAKIRKYIGEPFDFVICRSSTVR
jgi:hypothetical protein